MASHSVIIILKIISILDKLILKKYPFIFYLRVGSQQKFGWLIYLSCILFMIFAKVSLMWENGPLGCSFPILSCGCFLFIPCDRWFLVVNKVMIGRGGRKINKSIKTRDLVEKHKKNRIFFSVNDGLQMKVLTLEKIIDIP